MTMHGPESRTPEGRGAMSMMIRVFGWASVCGLTVAQLPVRAAGETAPDVARLQGELDRLKQEVADQRQLILQLMQAEQQRYDVILKYLRAGGGGGDLSGLPPPPSPSSMMPKGT